MDSRAVVSGGAGGALAPPEFGSSVNPIPIRGGRLCPPHYCTPGFENLTTELDLTTPAKNHVKTAYINFFVPNSELSLEFRIRGCYQ